MHEVILYGNQLSPFVEKVIRGLKYKRIKYRHVTAKSFSEMRKWNQQTHKVPVLEIDNEKFYDSTFILRKLDSLKPDPPFFSKDPVIAAHQRLLEDWADESLYWYIFALRWTKENTQTTVAQLMSLVRVGVLRPLKVLSVSRVLGRQPWVQGLGRLPYDVLIREIEYRLDELTLLLGDRPFLYSEHPSAADFAIYGVLNTGRTEATPDFIKLLSTKPALVKFMKRIENATSYQK